MTSDCKSHPSQRFIAPHVGALPRSGIRDFFDLVAAQADIISLGIGEPDFVTPWHIREYAITSLEEGATHYTSNNGLPELRRAVARYVAQAYPGLDYDWRSEVLITVGASEALDLALRAVVSPGDEVLYHEPCFVAYAPLIRLVHGVPVAVETQAADGFRLTLEALEAKVTPRTRVLLLNFPCNPTGAILDAADAQMLAEFVCRHDLLLITDEIYFELTYGPHVSVALQPSLRDRMVFINGFSKTWAMTGFRLGYLCAPQPLFEAIFKVHQFGMMCAPTLSQKAGVEAIENGGLDVVTMRSAYHERRNYIYAALRDMGLETYEPQGAFYIFPSIRSTGLDSHTFAMRLLQEERVACVPGSAFGACGEGFVRCSYATELDQIKEAMVRMERFVSKCGRSP